MRLLKFTGLRKKLPPRMGGGKEICDRLKDSEDQKSNAVTHMEECYRFAVPGRNTFFDKTKHQKKGQDLFDSTAVLGVPAWATRMQGLIMPSWREWSQLALGPDLKRIQAAPGEKHRVEMLLSEQNDTMFSHINHSNHSQQAHESFQDLCVGTGAYDIYSGKLGGRSLIFNSVPMTELVLEEGPQSTIETTFRVLEVKAGDIEAQWPGAQLPNKLAKMAREKPRKKVEMIEAVLFDPDREVWEGAAVWKDEKALIWQTTWNSNPRIVFRWSLTPGEIYGRGPVMQVLADIKTVNKVVEFILRNAAIIVAGMWTARNDSSLSPYNFRPAPGIVVPVQSNDQKNPSIRALERSGDLDLGFEIVRQLQANIDRALLQDSREPTDAVVSATQFAIEDQRLINQIGSTFGRLQTETAEKTIARVTDVLGQRGAMAQVRIDGRNVTLKHTSPLARAQDMDDLAVLERTLDLTPEAVAPIGLKIEDLPEYIARKTGLDPKLIREPGEKAEVKEMAAQLIAQSQQAQAA